MLDLISSNNSAPTQFVYSYISAFGGIIIAFAIIMIGIKMLLSIYKTDAREQSMAALGKIIAGSFIIGSCLVLAGFLAWIAKTSGVELTTATVAGTSTPTMDNTSTDDTFVIKAIASVIALIAKTIANFIEKGMGFYSLDTLIFNKDSLLSISKDLPPFSAAEWHNLNFMYISICTIVAPLLLIMVAKTGFELIVYADSTAKKVDLKEELSKWVLCAVLLTTTPIFIYAIFKFFNLMTDSLSTAVQSIWKSMDLSSSPVFNTDLIQQLQTGSVLTTAVVQLLYAWQEFKINLVFLSRKIVLAVMYGFTPIAIALWGINKRVRAISIWFGEIITNAAMQFFYAFTFTTMIVSLGAATWNNWLLAIIWMMALMKVAEMLRNSLQGLFTQLSGIDESSLASGALGATGSMLAGMTAAFGMTAGNTGFNAKDVTRKVFGDKNNVKSKNGKSEDNSSGGNAALGNISAATTPKAANKNKNKNQKNSSSGIDVISPNDNKDPDSINDADLSTDKALNTGDNPDTDVNTTSGNTDVNDADLNTSNVLNGGNLDNNNVGGSNLSARKGQPTLNDMKKQNAYNNLFANNLREQMSAPNRHNISGFVGGALTAMTAGDPAMSNLIKSAGNIVGGVQNRLAVNRAVKSTLDDMQELSGTKLDSNGNKVYNLDRKKAENRLFGDKGSAFKNAVNRYSIKRDIIKGDNESATSRMAAAHPFTKANAQTKVKILSQNNSYTSMDGFSGSDWKQ